MPQTPAPKMLFSSPNPTVPLSLSSSPQLTNLLHSAYKVPMSLCLLPASIFTPIWLIENAALNASSLSIPIFPELSSDAFFSQPSIAAQCLWDKAPNHWLGIAVFRDLSPESHLIREPMISPGTLSHSSVLPTLLLLLLLLLWDIILQHYMVERDHRDQAPYPTGYPGISCTPLSPPAWEVFPDDLSRK